MPNETLNTSNDSIHSPDSKKLRTNNVDIVDDMSVNADNIPSLDAGRDVALLEEFRRMRDEHAAEFKAIKSEMLKGQANLREMVTEIVKSFSAETRREVKEEIVKDIKEDVKEEVRAVFKQEMAKVERENNRLQERVDNDESKISRLEGHVKKIEDETRKGMDMIERVGGRVEEKMRFFEEKMLDLEARGRRNNLLFYGLKEEKDENCFAIIQDMIKNKLQIADHLRIERAHRIGDGKGQNQRPLIVRFLDFNDKVLVKKNRKSLPKEVSMSDDLPFPIRQAQKKLVQEMKNAKEAKQEAYIRFPATLVINGKPVRSVDPLTQDVRDGPPGSNPQRASYSDVARREQNSPRGQFERRNQPDENGWVTPGDRRRNTEGRGFEHERRGGRQGGR